MPMPWDISAEAIVQWADSFGSPERLHQMIRRLLLATAPLADLDLRADGGVRLEGPDAVVVAREEGPYWPRGMSFWELSTAADVGKKLRHDYAKKPPPGVNPQVSTYVAVTAQRLSPEKKEAWRQARRTEGPWADVRVLDADDLAGWLSVAPAVRFWFAEAELGQPARELRSVDEVLRELANRTRPPLPPEIALAGKQRRFAAEELLRALAVRDDRAQRMNARERQTFAAPPLRITAETDAEALAFVVATLAQPGAPDAERLRARTVIVDRADAMRFCLRAQSAEPLVLVPRFEGAAAIPAAGSRAQVVLPVSGERQRIQPGEGLALDVIPLRPLARALDEAGFPDAERLARESGGRMAKLQRLLGHLELPPWATGSPENELLALLLAGAWAPSRDPDREILRRLGADPDEAERLCVRLSQGDDPAFEAEDSRNGVRMWRWVTPRDAFRSLARNLTDTHLARFFDVALAVFSPPPPDPDEESSDLHARARVMVRRRAEAYSGALVQGIAASIAWLSVEDDALGPHLTGRGRGLAQGVARRALVPEARAWSFLAGVLQDLAEAAPRAFLTQLGEGLERGKDGIVASHHLLWALETLAYDRDLLIPVTEALARLPHDAEPKNQMHRPINSLREMLGFSLPQSQSTVADRIAALRNLFQKHNDLAWEVSVDMLGGLSFPRLVSPSPRPRYWRAVPAEDQRATRGEMHEQVAEMVGILIEEAGQSPDRWAALIPLPLDYLALRVLDSLESAYPRIEDTEAKIWNALREELGRQIDDREDSEEDEDKKKVRDERRKRRAHLESLYEHTFRPRDFVLEHAWLFALRAELPTRVPGGWQAEENKREELRREAVEALGRFAEDRWTLLGRLAARVKTPHILGQALAEASWSDDIEGELLAERPSVSLERVLPYFLACRFKGSRQWEWFERTLGTLLAFGRVDQAVATVIRFPATPRLWDLVESIGEPLRSEYWKRHEPLWLDALTGADYQRGIEHLLDAGRSDAALEAASQGVGKDKISSGTILRILGTLVGTQLPNRRDHGSPAYDIEQLFLALDRDSGVNTDEVLKLEILHAENLTDMALLEETRRGARRFYEKISSSSDAFLDVLRRLRLPEGERGPDAWFREPTDPAGIERKHLNTLLYHWRGYPGKDLPVVDREAILERWCTEVLQRSTEEGMVAPALYFVADIFARADPPEDGHWPCLTARRLIESGSYPHLRRDLRLAKYNRRGWHSRGIGEGGAQEREIARRYQAGAAALRVRFPATAAMLDDMAADYLLEAAAEEPEARRQRIEYGEDERASPRKRPSEAEPTGGPVQSLEITSVGPADKMRLDFGRRLNVLPGDNSAGKTFVLDVLWWALSGGWAAAPAWPRPGSHPAGPPAITLTSNDRAARSDYDTLNTAWPALGGRTAPDLVIYARIDGGFSVWDSLRNVGELSGGYHFDHEHLWKGLILGGVTVCNGLIEDVHDWYTRKNGEVGVLQDVLSMLSPPGETMQIGEPVQLPPPDERWYPTLSLSYGFVPISLASAAVRRVLSLAYLLIWSFQGHRRAAEQTGRPPARSLTLLIDEVEAHLHPKWQRSILPALLRAVSHVSHSLPVQVFVSTHAPLVLASLEPHFDSDQDALLHFELERGGVNVRSVVWTTQGDATNWLESPVMGLSSARSPEAERAIEGALAYLRGEPRPPFDTAEKIDAELRRTVPSDDAVAVDWFLERRRG